QRRVLLVVLRFADLARHGVALAELVPAHVGQRYVDVLLTRQVPGRAEETVSLREDVQDPGPGRSALELLDPILLIADLPILTGSTAFLAGRSAPAIALAAVRGTLPGRTRGALTVASVVARAPLVALAALVALATLVVLAEIGTDLAVGPLAAFRRGTVVVRGRAIVVASQSGRFPDPRRRGHRCRGLVRAARRRT